MPSSMLSQCSPPGLLPRCDYLGHATDDAHALAARLHGFCGGVGRCVDDGNSRTFPSNDRSKPDAVSAEFVGFIIQNIRMKRNLTGTDPQTGSGKLAYS